MSATSVGSSTRIPAILGGHPRFPQSFPFMEPTLPTLDAILSYYSPAYEQRWLTNGKLVERFESAAAERVQVPYAVATSSCTSGLMLVLRTLNLTGEVILPAFTFFATGHAVLWNGLRPVFADCDPETWNLDPADVERRITERTSAIIGVHLYGNPCNIEKLSAIASRHRLKLLFDAAHAFGSVYQGKPVGGFGDAEIFSLSPTKTLVCGEGGLVTTHDATLSRGLHAARNYGHSGSYDCRILGLSARMPEFNAALGLAGLGLVDAKIHRQNEIATIYTAGLSTARGIRFQKVHDGDLSTYKDYSFHVDEREFGWSRDQVAAALAAENIETKQYFFPPLNRQRLYHTYATPDLKNTDCIADGVLSLPIYQSLSNEIVEGIVDAVQQLSRIRH